MATATDVGDISSAISVAARKVSVTLKEKQLEAVEEYMKGNDTFFSLPTGYGKSLIYGILPSAFDILKGSCICNQPHKIDINMLHLFLKVAKVA